MSVGFNIAPPPSPLEMEGIVRARLNAILGLGVAVRAPTWGQLLFGGSRIDFETPHVPEGVLQQIDASREITLADDDETQAAGKVLDELRASRPRGASPRSVSARRQLPPSRDAMASWYRRVFLVTAGPAALRLLAAAGYLTPNDVEVMSEAWPKGVDEERIESVRAAAAVTAASARAGVDADMPEWLNGQLMTLMDEHRASEFMDKLYADEPEPEAGQPGGPTASAPKSNIVEQTRPQPSSGGLT